MTTASDLGSGPPKAGTVKADSLKGLTLTFVSYGGIYQDGQMKAAVDPFAKESGARIPLGPSDADDRVWLTFRPDAAAILA